MEQPMTTLSLWTIKGTVRCFGISVSQQLEESAAVWRLLACVCLQNDNARPHATSHTVKQIHDLRLEVLPYTPYPTDLAPSDFHLFWALKHTLRGRHFTSDEEVKKAVQDWPAQRPKDFFCRGICASVERWRCAERGGDYNKD
jgi:hypothetical protein